MTAPLASAIEYRPSARVRAAPSSKCSWMPVSTWGKASALDHPGHDQDDRVGREAAGQRRRPEHGQPGQEQAAVAAQVAQPRARDDQRRRCQQVAAWQAAAAYLHQIVVNGARASWRRRELVAHLLGNQAPTEGPDLAQQGTLLAALGQLPIGKRACLLLHQRLLELTHTEVRSLRAHCARLPGMTRLQRTSYRSLAHEHRLAPGSCY